MSSFKTLMLSGTCIGACSTVLTVVALYNGAPSLVRSVEMFVIVPFLLMMFTGFLFPAELGSGLPVFVFYLFLQWFVIGTIASYLSCRLLSCLKELLSG